MGEKIFVGTSINKGLRNDRPSFMIDNDSFPTLQNAYQWRGRVKRRRGTKPLTRLNQYVGSTDGSGNLTVTLSNIPITAGSSYFTVTGLSSTDEFTDSGSAPNPTTLLTNGSGSATLDRTTGVLIITGSQISSPVMYFPGLPVMGAEDIVDVANQFPGTIAFDTRYSYRVKNTYPYDNYNVSFYKNPATGIYPGYIQKTNQTTTQWNGEDYRQFWTTNYLGAFWATNGFSVPFSTSNIGMQYKPITGVTIDAAGPPALVTLTIVAHGLVRGDFVFINEVLGNTGLNFQTGYVVSADPQTANTVQVELPNATIAGAYTSGGIAQYLTNRSDPTKDCLRFYDRDPVTGTIPPTPLTGHGWVNFAPPLISGPNDTFVIDDLPPNQYYLVGARAIVPFKDRLLFFGPIVQTSAAGSQRYLQDTVIYSEDGSPYYTCSFPYSTVVPSPSIIPKTTFTPILLPDNQTALPSSYWEDVTGYGGFIVAGIDQPITTVSFNEDVLLVGFTTKQTRFVYTGNDIVPFLFYVINSELGSSGTFSSITMDRGAISVGPNGIIMVSQTSAQRIDLEIPDEVFQFRLADNGTQRICAQRDFINEWIYITYPSSNSIYKYPTQTLFYNYRDQSWGIFQESYTTYGQFREQSGEVWDDITTIWDDRTEPWDSGNNTAFQPDVIAGNAQGFMVFVGEGLEEADTGMISNIAMSNVTSINHNLQIGDYIIIHGAEGAIGSSVNNLIFSVANVTANSFVLNPTVPNLVYSGGGTYEKMYVPFIQTKQFPVSWEGARKTRLGPQQYLLSSTDIGQITLLIYLSQNGFSPYNIGPIVPSDLAVNNSLIYSTILYTCPESTNIGLTPANTNLQMVTAPNQAQIWHRMNTSLIGDTVQIGFTLSDDQMRTISFDDDDNPVYPYQFQEIELHSFILDVTPSQVLA